MTEPLPEKGSAAEAVSAGASNTGSTAEGTSSVLVDINQVAENTSGYLKSLGLDYGYGITDTIQWTMEHLHNFTGLGWGGCILATIAVLRIIQFPLFCKLSHTTALMKEIAPLTNQFTEKAKECQRRGDTAGAMIQRGEIMKLYKEAGVERKWLFLTFGQIPIIYCFYKVVNGMVSLPVPAMKVDGWLWFVDLTVQDPYYVLPGVASLLTAATLLFGGEGGASNLARSSRLILGVSIPVITFITFSSWPAGLALYFAGTSFAGLAQNLILRNKSLREWLGLHPLKSNVPNPLASPQMSGKLRVDHEALEALKEQKPITTPQKKQFGGEGSFLDRMTGGKMPEGSTFIERFTGKPDEKDSQLSISNWLKEGKVRAETSDHKAYEKKRKERLEAEKKQAAVERQRKLRKLQN
ncbi:hypothetical protein EX30DRAFT_337202 [Ascodesmis nigricans]|uniref:Membrane insertase YidC/Oxa/ALB C-terminal domain-containing protein n=1 Tax=Ascodesmis nigricans TaxID=341454 RepID=A0A4S2N636_9PEZI|nr:hypothetical protein EX30DRAFT_337202 [Ascodesmis nigricans]